jgi:hypothetical protein
MDQSPVMQVTNSIIEVKWHTQSAGIVLAVFAVVAFIVLFGIQFLNKDLGNTLQTAENLLIIAVIIYGALVSFNDRTIFEKNGRELKISYGPFPIMPGGKMPIASIKGIETTWNLPAHRGPAALLWHVVLTTKELRQYPVIFGWRIKKDEAKAIAEEIKVKLDIR